MCRSGPRPGPDGLRIATAGLAWRYPRLPVEDFLISGHVERFARRHRVTVLDRPGFGYSARPRKLATHTPRAAA